MGLLLVTTTLFAVNTPLLSASPMAIIKLLTLRSLIVPSFPEASLMVESVAIVMVFVASVSDFMDTVRSDIEEIVPT